MLSVLCEAPFVAIEPATGLGISGRTSGVVDNFQLNVLLMDAVPWTGSRRVSRAAVATASGEGPQQSTATVEGVWSLYSYAALGPDGRLPASPADDEVDETLIWDEGMPRRRCRATLAAEGRADVYGGIEGIRSDARGGV